MKIRKLKIKYNKTHERRNQEANYSTNGRLMNISETALEINTNTNKETEIKKRMDQQKAKKSMRMQKASHPLTMEPNSENWVFPGYSSDTNKTTFILQNWPG